MNSVTCLNRYAIALRKNKICGILNRFRKHGQLKLLLCYVGSVFQIIGAKTAKHARRVQMLSRSFAVLLMLKIIMAGWRDMLYRYCWCSVLRRPARHQTNAGLGRLAADLMGSWAISYGAS